MAKAKASKNEKTGEKRGRGRPARGEGTEVLGVTIEGEREGVRAPATQAAAIKAAATREGISYSTLLRRSAYAFATDQDAAATIRASKAWST